MKISLRDKKISPWNMKTSLKDKIISPWNIKIPNFLMWFKNGLKAQKLLAHGNTLGMYEFRKASRRICNPP